SRFLGRPASTFMIIVSFRQGCERTFLAALNECWVAVCDGLIKAKAVERFIEPDFLGKWTVESEIKANKYMPAGKGVSTETCTLGPGGFYAESLAEGQVPTRLAIIAYDSHAKAYTSYYASSVGLCRHRNR